MAQTSMAILGGEPATVLTTLSLTDFRSFASCRIDFHRRLTVVFDKNGTGKSLNRLATPSTVGDGCLDD
jgi:predicted ATPase